MVYDGEKVTKQALSNLKIFSIGELLLERLQINPEFIAVAEESIGHIGDFDYIYKNFEPFDPDIHDGDIVWLGYPGQDQLESVAEFIAQREFKTAFLIFPEIVCARWYSIIDSIEAARWFGAPPNNYELPPMWIDVQRRRAMDPHLTWWIARFDGH